jgi:hypothetical protein
MVLLLTEKDLDEAWNDAEEGLAQSCTFGDFSSSRKTEVATMPDSALTRSA